MSRKIRSESDLRKRVAEILKCPVPDWAWKIARMERMISEVLQGDNTPEWVAGRIKAFIDTGGPQTGAPSEFVAPRRQRRGKTVRGRQEVISEALATVARQEERVQWFRREILRGKLLDPKDIEDWIQDRRQEATYDHALVVRLKRGTRLDRSDGWHLEPPLSSTGPEQIEGLVPIDFVHYSKLGSKWVQKVPVPRDGPLRVLLQLSRSLASRFCWQAAAATTFLLTDITPIVINEGVELTPAPSVAVPWGGLMRWPVLRASPSLLIR